MALHAKTLGFVHPETGAAMFFDSDLPSDFEKTNQAWKEWAATEG